jgi:hypothetical protein
MLWVDLIGPYIYKRQKISLTVIDCNCLTTIEQRLQACSIFVYPAREDSCAGSDRKTQQRVGRTDSKTQVAIGQTNEAYLDKSSIMISKLVTAVLVQSVSSLLVRDIR